MITRRELILSGEAGGWKIDEIKGAVDGAAWSLRAIITDFLKY
ncbi:hypothetical protein [Bradyrhizobium sp. 200]|nr:hypothetical protein [Bradyrhizobium sp. 200]